MRKTSLVILLLLASVSASADHNRPISGPSTIGGLLPFCGQSYRFDSFGRGLESAFTGGADLRPRILDQECYDLGVAHAKEVLAAAENDGSFALSDCHSDFAAGRKQGFRVTPESAGSACYVVGYQAGESALDVGAREGQAVIVGMACVQEYLRGSHDGSEGRVATPPMEQPLNQCYSLGHFDGAQFQR